MNNYQANWEKYMQAWAQTDAKKLATSLSAVLDKKTIYIDPITVQPLVGQEAIQAYITQTQQMVPGVNLQLVAYEQHHDVSLAQWNMCDGKGNVIAPGRSFSRYNTEGKIQETVAFFTLPKG